MASDVRPYVIIGISGVTNGGKSTLCQRLLSFFPGSKYINMDDYFLPEDSDKLNIVPEVNHPNYEELCAVDFESLLKDVMTWTKNIQEVSEKSKNTTILLIDGILIYNYRPLVPFFDKKYFLTLSKEQCWERRKLRVYDPPDPPGYYDLVCWPMYLQNCKDIEHQKDLVFIDGSKDKEEIFHQVSDDITQIINNKL